MGSGSIIKDHAFTVPPDTPPERAYYQPCSECGYTMSAHERTHARLPDFSSLPYRCPNCVDTGIVKCDHGQAD